MQPFSPVSADLPELQPQFIAEGHFMHNKMEAELMWCHSAFQIASAVFLSHRTEKL